MVRDLKSQLMSGRMAAEALSFVREGRTAVEPRPASTVILLRDTPDGPEVYLLRRQQSMAFAAGMTVFPGGRVDPTDASIADSWSGPSPTWFGERLGCSAGDGCRLRCGRSTGDLRGVRCPACRPVDRIRRRRHHRRRLGGRPGRPRGALARVRRLPAPARPGTACRPPRRLGALDHPRVRTAALRHPLLRRRAPGRPGHPRRDERIRPGRLAAPGRRSPGCRGGRDADAAADVPVLPRPHPVRRGRGRAGGVHRPRDPADPARRSGSRTTRSTWRRHDSRGSHAVRDPGARGQPRSDDAGRHEHLDPPGARGVTGGRGRPRADARGPPARRARRSRAVRVHGRDWCC